MDANPRRVFLTQEIQADVAYNREIFVGMTEPDARFIFPKRDIENPMQAIFNSPYVSVSNPMHNKEKWTGQQGRWIQK
jgi:hypothetical protein